MTSTTNGHLVNGDSIQFEYATHESDEAHAAAVTDQTSSSKKKKKKKKSKKKTTPSVNVIGEELDFDDPDFEYPDSRILKQNSNGDVIVQSLEPSKKVKSASSNAQSTSKRATTSTSANDDLLPKDPVELNKQLKEYWQSLSIEEKKDLLNVERESVFKVMKDQQKITCNCSVCGRKRQIIEGELKKLYDTYFEDIDTHALLNSELFDGPSERRLKSIDPAVHEQQQRQKQKQRLLQQQQQQQFQAQAQQQQPSLPPSPLRTQTPQQQHQTQHNLGNTEGVPNFPPPHELYASFQAGINGQTETTRKNGIMSVAEDLLQNDGRKFLEMMEKLAESRIQRQTQHLKRPNLMVNSNRIEEEENSEYNSNDILDEEEDEVLDEDLKDLEDHQPQPQRQLLSILDIDFSAGYFEDSDSTFQEDDTDIDDLESEEFWSEEDPISKDDYLQLMQEAKSILDEDLANLTGDPEQILNLQLQKQKQLHLQLQREKQELEQLQEEFLDDHEEYEEEDYQEGEEDYEDEYEEEYEDEDDGNEEHDHHHSHTHTCGHGHHDHSHSHSHGPQGSNDKDMKEINALLNEDIIQSDEEFEEYSDEAIDEEQQLEEGRAMLQICTTKMLKQSLIESLKNKRREETVNALLHELDEEATRQKQKEEKKQREKERKREKKRLIQQQKEEERLRKEAEQERIRKEKEEEQKRKVEEGRKRKQEQDRKKLEEKRRKEEELERARKEKEEKKRLKEEEKRKKEEAERQKKLEEEASKTKQYNAVQEEQNLLQQQAESKALQQKIVQEEQDILIQQESLRALQQQNQPSQQPLQQQQLQSQQGSLQSQQAPLQYQDSRSQNLFNQFETSQPSANPLLDSVFQNSSFLSSPLNKHSFGSSQNLNAQTIPSHPPGFAIDNSLNQFTPTPSSSANAGGIQGTGSVQGSNSFFPTRLSDAGFNNTGAPSPWASQPSLASNVYNPIGLDSGVDTFPPQTRQSLSSNLVDARNGSGASTPLNAPLSSQNGFGTNGSSEIDFLSSKLSNTRFDDFGGSSILTGSRVWSNPNASHSDWSNTQLNSNIWGGSPAPNQAPLSQPQQSQVPDSFNVTPQSQPTPVTTTGSAASIDQLLQNYQAQILEAYTFAKPGQILNGGYMGIQDLYSSFNALQPHPIDFTLFVSILESTSVKYTAEVIKDDNGNISFVKLVPLLPLNRGLNGLSTSRSGSVFQLNQLGSGIPEPAGFGGLNSGFDQTFNHNGSLTWGSTL